MKYKVILYNNASSAAVDETGNFTFYTLNEAVAFVEAWRELAGTYGGILWNGTSWSIYSPLG